MMTPNDDEVVRAAMAMARSLGIDPAAMMVAGRMTPMGYEIRLLIVPDVSDDDTDDGSTDGSTDEPERAADVPETAEEREMREKIDQLFG